MSPVEDDPNVWAQLVAILCRLALRFVLWLEYALPVILPAGIAAYLYGRHFGYRGAALQLFVATGVFIAVVGTPVTLFLLGLDIELWKTVVCCGLSVFCHHIVRWVEAWVVGKLKIERRKANRGNEE